MPTHTIHVRRIYEEPQDGDGTRVLVDRLWPRGISKDRAHLDDWCKDIAPSDDLRRWYGHEPERFAQFQQRYRAELADPQRAARLQQLRELADAGTLTLLTATTDADISEAAVLADILRAQG